MDRSRAEALADLPYYTPRKPAFSGDRPAPSCLISGGAPTPRPGSYGVGRSLSPARRHPAGWVILYLTSRTAWIFALPPTLSSYSDQTEATTSRKGANSGELNCAPSFSRPASAAFTASSHWARCQAMASLAASPMAFLWSAPRVASHLLLATS